MLEIVEDPVLLWALKPADDGLESGLIARVWHLAEGPRGFSLKWNDGGLKAAQRLTHIETPIGDMHLQGGSLVDEILPQQMKTYGIYPAGLPYAHENLEPPVTLPPPDSPATPGNPAATIPAATPAATPTGAAGTEGKGCALGLLSALLELFK